MKYFILLLSFLAISAAQQATPIPIPQNRMQQAFNPDVAMVQGAMIQGALSPETTSVSKPKLIPPNRKQPVISKADVVMAATDRIGILVNNLAQNLAVDLRDLLNNMPVTPTQRGTRDMEDNEADDWAEP